MTTKPKPQPKVQPGSCQAPVPAGALFAMLGEQFHERPIAKAALGNGREVLLIFADEASRGWTAVILRQDDGVACMLMAGDSWEPLGRPL